MYQFRTTVSIGLLAALVSLSGCGNIRYPNYYVLHVPPPPASVGSKALKGSVVVREFGAPRFLKEGSIVYRSSAEQVDFYNYARWAEEPRRAVTQAMSAEIQARGLFDSVSVSDGGVASKYTLTGTLDHLEEVDEGSKISIEVGVSAQLADAGSGEMLWQGASTKTATLDRRTMEGIVSEMSRELASAVAELVSSMQDQLSTASVAVGKSNTDQ